MASQVDDVTAQYFRIFRWHVFRHLRRHPLLALLNILSVALGVAVYLATQIANQSANRAFAATVDLVAGKAELEITAPAGNLPETCFPLVAATSGISAATPIVRGLVTLPDFPGEYLVVLGIDIFTNDTVSNLRADRLRCRGPRYPALAWARRVQSRSRTNLWRGTI